MADEAEGEEEEEKVPELTNEEKVEQLKEMLERGEMGPAQFDGAFQSLWRKIKDVDTAAAEMARVNLRSTSMRGSMDIRSDTGDY